MTEPYIKVQSSVTGKIHYADDNGPTTLGEETVIPLCNFMSWRGDYWGHHWPKIDDQEKPVTCKNCIKAYIAQFGHAPGSSDKLKTKIITYNPKTHRLTLEKIDNR
jgi:hypothetical protein